MWELGRERGKGGMGDRYHFFFCKTGSSDVYMNFYRVESKIPHLSRSPPYVYNVLVRHVPNASH